MTEERTDKPQADAHADARPSSQPCPMCGSSDTRVEEDVSDEVTVYACEDCGATWADRNDG